MNELNLIRCKHIPKRPGCDWHDLPEEKVRFAFTLPAVFHLLGNHANGIILSFHGASTGETVNRANGGPDTLVLAQHSQKAQSVERPIRQAGLGGQLPHLRDRSPANGQGRHVLPP